MHRADYPERANCRPFASLRVAGNGLSMTALFFHTFRCLSVQAHNPPDP